MPETLRPIAIAHTPFKEKFAIPRQPGLARAALARIELLPPLTELALQGLEQVSHVWLLFQFHAIAPEARRQQQVRPPRLGGNKKIGVLASRSTHRPNGIGMSLVTLERIEGNSVWVSGVDLLDGTPIVDIKPYIPYADCVPEARNGLADAEPKLLTVQWHPLARQQADVQQARLLQPVVALIEQVLAQDPKPAYQQPTPERIYGVRLWDLDVRWHYPTPECIEVLDIQQLQTNEKSLDKGVKISQFFCPNQES